MLASSEDCDWAEEDYEYDPNDDSECESEDFSERSSYDDTDYSVEYSSDDQILQNLNKPKIKEVCLYESLNHLYQNDWKSFLDEPVIQKLLGHSSIKTTQIYTQISQASIKNVKSPLDNL